MGWIDNQLGTNNKTVTKKRTYKAPLLPWKTSKDSNDLSKEAFFPAFDIDPDRWNKFYPYRLLVVDVEPGIETSVPTILVSGKGSLTGGADETITTYSVENGNFVLTEEILGGRWICNLPITPQQLQITDQFAINTTATMRGIVEEHNGVKFKLISASGTTGIWPRRNAIAAELKNPSSLGSIFGGTLSAVQGIAGSFNKLANSFSNSNNIASDKANSPGNSDAGQFSTGYYQALFLGQFLERYAIMKKNPKNRHLRLVFDIPKQNQSFVVTPVQFTMSQNHQKPNEMLFNFQLKAWKRIDLNLKSKKAKAGAIPKIDLNFFQMLMNAINNVRSLIASAVALVKAVVSDIRALFDVLRRIAMAIKDIAGFIQTCIDLPGAIISDFKSLVIDQFKSIGTAFASINNPYNGNSSNVSSPPLDGKTINQSSRVLNISNAIKKQNQLNEGLSSDAVKSGALGENSAAAAQADPINKVFESPEEYFDAFNAVSIDSLPLNQPQKQAVEDELEKVRLLRVDDFNNFKQVILNAALAISNSYGGGNSTFSEIYGKPAPKIRATPITVEENEILVALMDVVQLLDELTSTKIWDDLHVESPLEYIGGLANDVEIDFTVPNGKMVVPVPFGLTIEQVAVRYLGDPDKWIEIASLNALQSPYIDETGYIYPLLSNAEGRQFNVNNIDERLYIGQQITLQSSSVGSFVRNIIDIQKITDGNYLITVDGLANLNNLALVDGATLHGYLPGTVNSQNQIFIPTNQSPEPDDRVHEITGLDTDTLTKISQIDWLLTSDFDLAINSDGDFRLANGLNNLVQALLLKVKTPRLSLLRHLDYGLGIKVGMSIADLQSGELIKSFNNMVESDPRFESIERLQFTITPPKLGVSMTVRVANGGGVLPLSFDLRM